MKPDYAKILFVSVPLTFIFWFFCFFGLIFAACDKNIVIYGALLLTVVFFITFIFLCIRYAKKMKTEVEERTPQSGGILLFVMVISAVALLAILGIFFNVPVKESQKYIAMAGVILTVVGKLLKKRT